MQPKYLLAGIVMLFWLSTSAHASTYFGFDTFGGTWQDVDRTGNQDDQLCWAFSAANVLAYTGWGIIPEKNLNNADAIFAYFKDNWTNQGGNIYYAIDWWFDGSNDKQVNPSFSPLWSQVKQGREDKGGFYADKKINNYQYFDSSDQYAFDNATDYLKKGYSVSLSLTGPTNHSVTMWGYDYDALNNYRGVWITDSADNYDGLKYYEIEYMSDLQRWFLKGYANWATGSGYYISEVYGLQIKDNFYSTPEPATFLLFTVGIAGFAATRRKRYIQA